jgi:hypothetical protein
LAEEIFQQKTAGCPAHLLDKEHYLESESKVGGKEDKKNNGQIASERITTSM